MTKEIRIKSGGRLFRDHAFFLKHDPSRKPVPTPDHFIVMPALVAGIHAFVVAKTWMAGTSPAMTPCVQQGRPRPKNCRGLVVENYFALNSLDIAIRQKSRS